MQIEMIGAELQYPDIFERLGDAVFIIETDTRSTLYVNQQAVILTGYSKEELLRSYQQGNISTRLIELWPAEKIITAWLAGEQDFEFEMRHKNGSMFFIKVSAAIVFVAGKECIMAFARDITARKSEEQLLRQSESKYRHLFENNPVAIFIWDMSTLKVTEVNKSSVIMFGYNKKEFENFETRLNR